MLKILLIGAGQIGSRHLQALGKLDQPANIHLVDPSENSLKIATERFNEVASGNTLVNLTCFASLRETESHYDVALVTTDSKPRRKIVEELCSVTHVKYLLLEKFLFVDPADYDAVSKLLKEKNIQCWVNTARRLNAFYQTLPEKFKNSQNGSFQVTGSDWGLGCNGIHFLDLFVMIFGYSPIQLSTEKVDHRISESKRKGYIEFTGTLTGIDNNGNRLSITSTAGGNDPIKVEIANTNTRVKINELAGVAEISESKDGWIIHPAEFRMKFQSDLTQRVVKDLVETGNCQLPTYQESSDLHLLFLTTFISFQNKILSEPSEICLIT